MNASRMPRAGAPVPADIAVQCVRAILKDWRGRGGLVVFGAGAHTAKIMPALTEHADLILGIVDDSPERWGQMHGRWKVAAPYECITSQAVTGILISSDVFQQGLEARVREEFGKGYAVLTLYPVTDDDGPKLPFTGERQVGSTLDQIELGHKARYYWALQRIDNGARVLDAACGAGYGTCILAEGGARVLGVDISEQAIAFARHYYGGTGRSFASAGVDDLPAIREAAGELAPFDCVVSLETIEHLERPEALLKTAFHLLRPGGTLLCSTPNADVMPLSDTPFHHRHFRPEETIQLLAESGFLVTDWYGQEGLQILRDRYTDRQRYLLFHAIRPGR